MDVNEIGRKLVKLGQREHTLLVKLTRVADERCQLLQQVAADPAAGVDAPVVALAVAPKEPPPGGGD